MSENQKIAVKYFKIEKRYIVALIIFIFFFSIYLVFLTNNHFSADGATRCLDVFWNEKVTLHGNNHILYPFNVYSWYKLTSFFLGDVDNSFDFIGRIQVMNALAASIILAFSYLIYLKFLKKETLSILLVSVFGISYAFLNHATSSSEPITAFLFFIVSFYLVVYFLDSKRASLLFIALSALIFAYSIMSYMSMVFGLPLILAYIYHKRNNKSVIIGYLILFFIFLGLLFISSAYYKGFTIMEIDKAFLGGEFVQGAVSHAGFKLKNIPQYPFGMISAFFHIEYGYDLPTYISSLKDMETNSLFSVLFGLALGCIIVIVLFSSKGLFKILKDDLIKKRVSLLTVCLIYFFSAAVPIIIYTPIHDKVWIMGLHSFLLLGGVLYNKLKRTQLIKLFFFIAVLILIIFNVGFLIKSKTIPKGTDCVENSLKLMEDKYILLSTWGDNYGKYFSAFYYNDESEYYQIPNLAIDHDMDTKRVIAFLKNDFCNGDISTFYVISGVLMDEYMWNTFLGDEMRMDYSLFHEELLDHIDKVTECVYELDRDVCNH